MKALLTTIFIILFCSTLADPPKPFWGGNPTGLLGLESFLIMQLENLIT